MSKIHTYYDDLKISRDAPNEVIRAAYKSLSLKYHPDRYHNSEATEIMATINIAYEVLSDPLKRKQHDEWIEIIEKKSDDSPQSAFNQPFDKPDLKVSDRNYSFQISSGPFKLIKRLFEINYGRIRYGDKEIKCSDAEWLKIGILTQTVNNIKSGTYYNIQIGSQSDKISVNINDVMYGSSGRKLFNEIHDAVMECVSPNILNRMIRQLLQNQTFQIGKACFKKQGVILPRHKLIVFTNGEELVEWKNLSLSVGNGLVTLQSLIDKNLYTSAELRLVKNAYLLIPLFNFLVKSGNYKFFEQRKRNSGKGVRHLFRL